MLAAVLGMAEMCQLFYSGVKNVAINSFQSGFNEDSKLRSAIFVPFVS
jgi:hypothetical protein